jgi:ABC-type transporter Mla subunit MlaD
MKNNFLRSTSALFCLLSFSILFLPATSCVADSSASVRIQFDHMDGVRVGTPVFHNGKKVGSVSQVALRERGNREQGKNGGFDVLVRLDPESAITLKKGTVAVVSFPSPAANNSTAVITKKASKVAAEKKSKAAKSKPTVLTKSCLELFIPSKSKDSLSSDESVTGYSSYEEFWSAKVQQKSNRFKRVS